MNQSETIRQRRFFYQAKSADVSNAFFGKFAALFPTRPEREAFAQTQEYRDILRLPAELAQSEKAKS